jgi:hypothetical protein
MMIDDIGEKSLIRLGFVFLEPLLAQISKNHSLEKILDCRTLGCAGNKSFIFRTVFR